MEASAKPKTYEPDEIEAKLKEAGEAIARLVRS